jgi:hypothetical protein
MFAGVDVQDEFFTYTTRFNTKSAVNKELFMLDSLLTVTIIHQLVVFYWRGVWQLLEIYLLPHDHHQSAIACLCISYILQLVSCLLQPTLNHIYRRHSTAGDKSIVLPWILETASYFVANLVCVTHWRAIWLLLDLTWPGVYSATVTHLAGLIGLWVLLCGHSVTVSGCNIDGDSEPAQGCILRNYYVRYFVSRRQQQQQCEEQEDISRACRDRTAEVIEIDRTENDHFTTIV